MATSLFYRRQKPVGPRPTGRGTGINTAWPVRLPRRRRTRRIKLFQRIPRRQRAFHRRQSLRPPPKSPFIFSSRLNLSGNARVADPDGITCNTSPVGREFVHLPLRNNQLAPGQSIEMPVTIANPEKRSIVFDLKVLAGA